MLNIEEYKDKLIELGVINIDPLSRLNLSGKLEEKRTGRRYSGSEIKEWLFQEYEEPEVDWSKVKVDTPILVKDTKEEKWVKRYFAKFEYGVVWSFCDGRTSWTARKNDIRNDTISWKCAKLAESEE